MKSNTAENRFNIIVPTTDNEIGCIAPTLGSIVCSALESSNSFSLYIVPNNTDGTISEVASNELLTLERTKKVDIDWKVIDTDANGKNLALNAALDSIDTTDKSSCTFALDSDCLVDIGAFSWAMDLFYEKPGIQAVTLMHAPRIECLPKNTDLATILLMNYYHRLATQDKKWLHGAFMGWKTDLQIGGSPLRFPTTKLVDDIWLTSAILQEYGEDSISCSYDFQSRFIPPATWDDYYLQYGRYAQHKIDLREYEPGLAQAYGSMMDKFTAKDAKTQTDIRWRAICEANGIDFLKFEVLYMQVLETVRATRDVEIRPGGSWDVSMSTKAFAPKA